MTGSQAEQSPTPPTENNEKTEVVRSHVRNALDWLLVPASVGAIANVAAIPLLGTEVGTALVVVSVAASAAAKIFADRSAEAEVDLEK